jgi:lipopolysaccharide export system permease protein
VGLAVQNLAAREPALIPLIWIHAILPGVVCAWFLFAPAPLPRRLLERFA